jgi:hypothetical protein
VQVRRPQLPGLPQQALMRSGQTASCRDIVVASRLIVDRQEGKVRPVETFYLYVFTRHFYCAVLRCVCVVLCNGPVAVQRTARRTYHAFACTLYMGCRVHLYQCIVSCVSAICLGAPQGPF